MTEKAQKKPPSKTTPRSTKQTPIKKKTPTRTELKTIKNKSLFFERYSVTGNISECCRQCNIGRQTFYEWMKNDVQFKQDFEDAEDSLIDFAEGKLLNLIDERNPTAIIFFLKTKGKERGYIEPSYLNIEGKLKHAHSHRMSLKEMKKSYDRAKRKTQE